MFYKVLQLQPFFLTEGVFRSIMKYLPFGWLYLTYKDEQKLIK